MNQSTSGQGRTPVAERLCVRCEAEPRKRGQRVGKVCHAAYMRRWRAEKAAWEAGAARRVADEVARRVAEQLAAEAAAAVAKRGRR